MNYILANQDTVLTQITQLESAITQTEVSNTAVKHSTVDHDVNAGSQLAKNGCVHSVSLTGYIGEYPNSVRLVFPDPKPILVARNKLYGEALTSLITFARLPGNISLMYSCCCH